MTKREGSNEFFYLANDIDFNGYEAPHAVNAFSGVLYGAGHTIKNAPFSQTSDSGLFQKLGEKDDVAIVKLNLGSEDLPIIVQNQGSYATVGVLASYCNSGYTLVVSDVNVYADIGGTGRYFAGFVGRASDFACYDSNFYGDVVLVYQTNWESFASGFVAWSEKCSVGAQFAESGYSGSCYMAYDMKMVNCKNFARINFYASNWDKEAGYYFIMGAAGFVGKNDKSVTSIVGCTNLGDIISNKKDENYVSPFVFYGHC